MPRTMLPTVGSAVVTRPKTLPESASIGNVRRLLSDDHVHLALIVEDGRLLTAIDRDDLPPDLPDDTPAREHGHLGGRTLPPHALLEPTLDLMRESGRGRVAVVDGRGMLIGLLCLKRSGNGFCSDADVRARAAYQRLSHLAITMTEGTE